LNRVEPSLKLNSKGFVFIFFIWVHTESLGHHKHAAPEGGKSEGVK
jgi:hypothetical protein